MNELPELIGRKIWKYRFNYVLQDINKYNHKLLDKYDHYFKNIYGFKHNGGIPIDKLDRIYIFSFNMLPEN